MKRVILGTLIFTAAATTSCTGSGESQAQTKEMKEESAIKSEEKVVDTKVTESGLKVEWYRKADGGKAPNSGDMVKVHYRGTLEDGTPFDNSYDRGQPLPFKLGIGQVIKGWDEGVGLLKVGEKAKLTIPGNLGYGERGSGQIIGPNATLVFVVELMDVVEPVVAKPYDYQGKKEVTTASGLKYYLVEATEGASPQVGQTVEVHYTGYLEDGQKFDSSVERGATFKFPLGQGRVIKGWDEGVALLKIGEKARLILPADLAYGSAGAGGVIPPNATLHFDVELISFQ